MPREPEPVVTRVTPSREFKDQSILTMKVVGNVGGLRRTLASGVVPVTLSF